jgi:hypothetical protein
MRNEDLFEVMTSKPRTLMAHQYRLEQPRHRREGTMRIPNPYPGELCPWIKPAAAAACGTATNLSRTFWELLKATNFSDPMKKSDCGLRG